MASQYAQLLNGDTPAQRKRKSVCLLHPTYETIAQWLSGVVARMSDLRLAVVGSNPGHGTAGFSEIDDRFLRVNYLGM